MKQKKLPYQPCPILTRVQFSRPCSVTWSRRKAKLLQRKPQAPRPRMHAELNERLSREHFLCCDRAALLKALKRWIAEQNPT